VNRALKERRFLGCKYIIDTLRSGQETEDNLLFGRGNSVTSTFRTPQPPVSRRRAGDTDERVEDAGVGSWRDDDTGVPQVAVKYARRRFCDPHPDSHTTADISVVVHGLTDEAGAIVAWFHPPDLFRSVMPGCGKDTVPPRLVRFDIDNRCPIDKVEVFKQKVSAFAYTEQSHHGDREGVWPCRRTERENALLR